MVGRITEIYLGRAQAPPAWRLCGADSHCVQHLSPTLTVILDLDEREVKRICVGKQVRDGRSAEGSFCL